MLSCQSDLFFSKKSGSIKFRGFFRDLLSLTYEAMIFPDNKN